MHLKAENFGEMLCLVLPHQSQNIVGYSGGQSLAAAFPMFYLDPKTITKISRDNYSTWPAPKVRFELLENIGGADQMRHVDIMMRTTEECKDLLEKLRTHGVRCKPCVK